jgi:alcohol dehydrogenase class IV
MRTDITPGNYRNLPIDRIAWGPFDALVEEAVTKAGARRAMIVISGTLRQKTDTVARLEQKLGDRLVAVFSGIHEHAPLPDVLNCVLAAREARPDVIVTLGGSTPIDTVKVVQLALAHDWTTLETLTGAAGRTYPATTGLRQIAVPTTLSGGEFTSIGGATDTATKSKVSFIAPNLCPETVILDPALTVHTPEWLWLSTAVRSIDHAVEGVLNARGNPMIEAQALHALSMFFRELAKSKSDPGDLAARLACQQAVWLSTAGLGRVSMGASHGIGYILGTVGGVPHGYTSCVMLPAVLEWSESATKEAQGKIARAMGHDRHSPAMQLRSLLRQLELPQRLPDVGIREDQLDEIAQRALRHPVVLANARPIKTDADVREILALAWKGA